MRTSAESLEDLLVEKGVITKSEAREVKRPQNTRVYWNNGTRVDFDDNGFTAKVNADVVGRYSYADASETSPNTSSFSVERARLTLSGAALYGEFTYKLEAELSDGDDPLRDAFLEWHACDFTGIRMGQFKPVVSRQFNTPATMLLLPNRSVVSDFFTFDRNQGVQGNLEVSQDIILVGQFMNGVSDGEGINREGVDTSHTATAGLRAALMGQINSYSESDIEYTEDAALDIGVAMALSEANQSLITSDITTVSADANFKRHGMSLNGEFFYQENDPDAGSSVETLGFYVQGGYFLTPKALEFAARYSNLDCDNGAGIGNGFMTDIANTPSCAGNDSLDAVDLGLNYYWWEHRLKAQFAWMRLSEDRISSSNEDTSRWIFQLSSWF